MAFFQCLFILTVKTVSSQFTPHVDLQKLGEIKVRGEKYNLLKPTVHKVTDHLDDEKLRRDTRDGQRVFMDDYGFRHFWQGFENRKSYGKTENDIDYRRDEDPLDMNKEQEDNALRRAPPAKAPAKPPPKPTAKPAAKPTAKPTAKPAAKATVKPTAKPAAKPQQPKQATGANTATAGTDNIGRDRTLGKSYFFCPFFGIIAMNGFVD